jgi:hypothetical protein
MEIETARTLLSTMIMAIPVLMTFFLIALFAFPRTKAGFVKNTRFYDITLILVICIVALSSTVVFVDFIALADIDLIIGANAVPYFSMFELDLSVVSSLILLMVMPIFLTIVLIILRHVERK